jgi:Holliday junction resolvase
MNRKAKGNRNEYKSMRLLEAIGYICFRMAGSFGIFDLIAVSPTDILFIQVKSNRMPSRAELNTIKSFACPFSTRKIIHVWQDRNSTPIVKEL